MSETESPLMVHYRSYRSSFLKDLLPGCQDYSKTTTPSNDFHTYYEYIETLGRDIYRAVEGASLEEYLAAITRHKTALIGLLETMAATVGGPREALEEGWEVFKFSRAKGATITFKEDFPCKIITVIPYYGDFCKEVWSSDGTVIDVDEALMMKSLPWEGQKEILLKKKQAPACKILNLHGEPIPLRQVNTPYAVGDWKLLGCAL